MSKKRKHIISLFFIVVLLFKGVATLTQIFPSALNDRVKTELLAETEPEQKKGSSKTSESSVGEELFDDTIFICNAVPSLISLKKSTDHTDSDLSCVWLDINTPPPNDIA